MSLTDEQRNILVNYRIEKSYRDFDDAVYLAKDNRFDSAANKLYYATYHIVSALLLKHGYETKTHTGIKRIFGQHFVNTGLVSEDDAVLFAQLFSKRQTGDYTDIFYLQAEDVLPYIEPTRLFIAKVEQLVNSNS